MKQETFLSTAALKTTSNDEDFKTAMRARWLWSDEGCSVPVIMMALKYFFMKTNICCWAVQTSPTLGMASCGTESKVVQFQLFAQKKKAVIYPPRRHAAVLKGLTLRNMKECFPLKALKT